MVVGIGLVLSGGGARCLAQIGALKALEDRGTEVGAIAANSTAALLGAIYAAGHPASSLYELAAGLDYSRFLRLSGEGGLLGHDGVAALLREYVPETFEELAIPLAVPAVDIQNGEMLVFSAGPLVEPVCASNALPGLFVPVEHQSRFLMDGGIIDNVPVDLIRPLYNGPVVVVDVRLSPTERLDLERPNEGLWERLRNSFSSGLPLSVDILMKAYTITQSRLIEFTYAAHPPDLIIRPELGDDFDLQDFGRFDEAYDLGYRAATEKLEQAGL
ncbi:MAG: patatin-like phospholipase family protein [Trueperaceae bacterium]